MQCYMHASGDFTIVSCAGDSTVKVWTCKGEADLAAVSLKQTIDLGTRLAHCVDVASLPVSGSDDWTALSLGVDRTIKLMVAPPGGEFQESFSLVGHQDWVRAVRFQAVEIDGHRKDLLLASGSQDKTIRIWRATPATPGVADGKTMAQDNPLLAQITKLASKPSFLAGTTKFTVALEAVLVGHEDWVHSLSWEPCPGLSRAQLCLLSASMDRTMMLWRPDMAEPGVWMSEESVGDAGSSALGYFGGVFSPCGHCIIAHGFSGALHLWKRDDQEQWQPQQALGGHFASVTDCHWVLGGDALISASADQTVRVTACSASGWYELARPQVHGHNLSCIAPLPLEDSNVITGLRYVSGSEEKILRVFQAPAAFASSIQLARGQQVSAADQAAEGIALGASLAALGLSNKAMYASDNPAAASEEPPAENPSAFDDDPSAAPRPCTLEGPPFEEQLAQNTLWPEIRKLFGHGNDIISLAADPTGFHIASACRAQNVATATIRVWSTKDWSTVAQLKSHTLTVTALEWAPSGHFLLSASRDRSFSLFERHSDAGGFRYSLMHRQAKAHDRILWDVSWAPGSDLFATCSRDKTVKFWRIVARPASEASHDQGAVSAGVALVHQHIFDHPVVSVAFLPEANSSAYTIAIGFEDGSIAVAVLPDDGQSTLRTVWESTAHSAHCAAVKRLCWSQAAAGEEEKSRHEGEGGSPDRYMLASCGEDNKLRVFQVTVRR
ncbi:uncharacterized protein LOC142357762 [Convolutriloba macropyga]|uniref:uncharacterized protein LOC142357762 n=1 Tax=Convolutriloba macropyga TaxID=536237 RepID=UPI003F51C696